MTTQFNNFNTNSLRGAQGPRGFQGPQGFPAPINRNLIGLQGFQGVQGVQGVQGLQGVQGIIGMQGIQGIQGAQGLQNNSIGTRGLQGYEGSPGLMGAQGPQQTQMGTQGPQGFIGRTGMQGSEGPEGFVGSTGQPGPQGFEGSQGLTQGVQGAQGVQGVVGPQGQSLNFSPDSFIGYEGLKNLPPNTETSVYFSQRNNSSIGIVGDSNASNYTVATTGWYSVTFTVTITSSQPTIGTNCYIFATINGNKVAFQNARPEDPTAVTSYFTEMLATGTVLSFWVYLGVQNTSGATYFTNAPSASNVYRLSTATGQRVDSYLSIKYIGDQN